MAAEPFPGKFKLLPAPLGAVLAAGATAAALAAALVFPALAGGIDVSKSGLVASNGTIAVGAPAPPLMGVDIKGVAIGAATFKGRPVLVDFGSLLCSSCQQTLTELARLEKTYQDSDLAFVVVTDGSSAPEAMNDFFGGLGATYTVIRDQGGKLFDSYGVIMIPLQVVIDRQGIVRKINTGFTRDMETLLGLRELAAGGAVGGKRRTGGAQAP